MRGLTSVRQLVIAGLVGLLGAGCAYNAPPAPTAMPTAQAAVARASPTVSGPSPAPPRAQPTVAPLTATITILYDNIPHREGLQTAWGYACLVQTGEVTILFDTGRDGAMLLANMAALAVELEEIDVVVLSHTHDDHTDGLAELLSTGVRPAVYLPASLPDEFKRQVASETRVVEVTEPVELAPGVYSTGEVGPMIEQALAVQTGEGIAVITGCAHPGIVEMVRAAGQVAGGEVALVMGGFHLGVAGQAQIERIIQDLRGLGVQRVAPSHCTGDRARPMFAEAFGDACLPAGAGWTVTVGAPAGT